MRGPSPRRSGFGRAGGSSPRMTRRVLQHPAQFRFTLQTAKRPRSRAAARVEILVCLPQNEGRRSAERRVVNKPRLISRIAGRQQHTATPRGAPPRRLLRPWDLTSGYSARAFARHPGRFPRPSPAPVQPLKAAPHSGHGRLPRAPRVHACEAWPRAPHPAGLGYPAPAKLKALSHFRLASRSAPSLDRTPAG